MSAPQRGPLPRNYFLYLRVYYFYRKSQVRGGGGMSEYEEGDHFGAREQSSRFYKRAIARVFSFADYIRDPEWFSAASQSFSGALDKAASSRRIPRRKAPRRC